MTLIPHPIYQNLPRNIQIPSIHTNLNTADQTIIQEDRRNPYNSHSLGDLRYIVRPKFMFQSASPNHNLSYPRTTHLPDIIDSSPENTMKEETHQYSVETPPLSESTITKRIFGSSEPGYITESIHEQYVVETETWRGGRTNWREGKKLRTERVELEGVSVNKTKKGIKKVKTRCQWRMNKKDQLKLRIERKSQTNPISIEPRVEQPGSDGCALTATRDQCVHSVGIVGVWGRPWQFDTLKTSMGDSNHKSYF